MPRKKGSPADPLSVGHHSSDTIWGYDVDKDGVVHLNDATADPLAKLIYRQHGLQSMLNGVSAFVANELAGIEGEKRMWWRRTFAALGVAPGTGERWSFDPNGNTIRRAPKDEGEEP